MPPSSCDPAVHKAMCNSHDTDLCLADLAQRDIRVDVHLYDIQKSPGRTLASVTKEPQTRETDVSKETKDYVYQKVTSEFDFDIVFKSLCDANDSCWYYGDCSSAEAKAVLKHQPRGTFIIRNSSDPKYLFALSVKTERGPTSVRIRYSRGLFQLDCEDHLKNKLPKCESVVGLVNFHIALSRTKVFKDCRWLEKSGCRDMPVYLTQPKRNQVPTLQHLCRLQVNSSLTDLHFPERSTRRLPLPKSMMTYLEDYPYTI
ncbi:suppressor of cytokine signaling 2-like [Haliotis rufescens]|uniref:suppressor of cytokine signaling 2-like n=1 Tax=Haliotis rufescens TaxID=6454 RepID=UPI001EAFED6B|nr:suppressor of cytokine signaling 2-like [Haliotis rufescens]